ncbi:MAG: hypothetical protein O3A00_03405 [Planctomycetota bacterium]|nr:hypothetical protein [Planctomycetota bacterium]
MNSIESRLNVLRILFTTSLLILIGATWMLWLPHAAIFPQVPVARSLSLPPNIDIVCLAVILASLFAALVTSVRKSKTGFRCATVGCVVAFASSIAIDQQRFQPWVYHLVLGLLVAATGNSRRSFVCLRILVCGIYLHSALSKLDVAFLDQHGRYILSGFFQSIGLHLEDWLAPRDPRWLSRRWVIGVMPVAELLVALGLCWSQTRKFAVVLAITTHMFLMLALGPWGLGHEIGVLIWNAVFIVQAILLFWPSTRVSESAQTEQSPWSHSQIAAAIVVATVSLAPFARPMGWIDPWPSWALYSPRSHELRITISERDRDGIDERNRRFVSEPDFSGRCSVRIDRWSLTQLSVPVYPSERIEVAAALWLRQQGAESVQLHAKSDPASVILVDGNSPTFALLVDGFRLNVVPR